MQDILGMVGCTCYRSPKVHKFEYNPWRCIWHETIRVFAKPKEIFRFLDLHMDNIVKLFQIAHQATVSKFSLKMVHHKV